MPAAPQTGPVGDNDALAIVVVMLAVVKFFGVEEMVTLFVVATSP